GAMRSGGEPAKPRTAASGALAALPFARPGELAGDRLQQLLVGDRLGENGPRGFLGGGAELESGEIDDLELRPAHQGHAAERQAMDAAGHLDVGDQKIDGLRAVEKGERRLIAVEADDG